MAKERGFMVTNEKSMSSTKHTSTTRLMMKSGSCGREGGRYPTSNGVTMAVKPMARALTRSHIG